MRRALVALGCAVAFLVTAPGASASATHRAGVIVETGADVHRVVVTFDGDSISGIEALQLTGADPVVRGYSGQGGAVCTLFGVGHAADDSCLGTPDDPRYWAYFRAPAGASSFSYSRGCACTTRVHDGDVEGWRFGTGAAPVFVSFATLTGDVGRVAPSDSGGAGDASPAASSEAPRAAAAGSGSVGGPASGAPGSAVTSATAAALPAPTTPPRPSTSRSSASTRDAKGVAARRANGGSGRGGGDGSPVSLVAFVAVLGALVAGVLVIRRSRSGRTTGGP